MPAGDLRRARTACERLVLLCGDRQPNERRDLGVILVHCGLPEQVHHDLALALYALPVSAFQHVSLWPACQAPC